MFAVNSYKLRDYQDQKCRSTSFPFLRLTAVKRTRVKQCDFWWEKRDSHRYFFSVVFFSYHAGFCKNNFRDIFHLIL